MLCDRKSVDGLFPFTHFFGLSSGLHLREILLARIKNTTQENALGFFSVSVQVLRGSF